MTIMTYAITWPPVLTANIFEWGNVFFLQLIGTAMGMSSSVMSAIFYHASHDVHKLISMHDACPQPPLLLQILHRQHVWHLGGEHNN